MPLPQSQSQSHRAKLLQNADCVAFSVPLCASVVAIAGQCLQSDAIKLVWGLCGRCLVGSRAPASMVGSSFVWLKTVECQTPPPSNESLPSRSGFSSIHLFASVWCASSSHSCSSTQCLEAHSSMLVSSARLCSPGVWLLGGDHVCFSLRRVWWWWRRSSQRGSKGC